MQPALREAISPHTVNVRSLSLTHFRNYAELHLEVTAAPIVITGSNGAGKTNILEAVSLLTPGKGFRKSRLADMDNKRTQSGWVVAAEVASPQGSCVIGTGRGELTADERVRDRRLVKIDGKMLRGQAELARACPLLWLVPQMDGLFLESASVQRKFFDRMVYAFDPDHARRINAYEHTMRERNALLADGVHDTGWLAALEQKLAELSVEIARSRRQTAQVLNRSIHDAPYSFPKAEIRLAGGVESRWEKGEENAKITADLLALLVASRKLDAASGKTSHGAHKTTLTVEHLGKRTEAQFCSTGEQKALLLSLVLGQVRAGAGEYGIVPVLLLDEVVAHLDDAKRSELFAAVQSLGAQVWMTGTEAETFKELRSHAQFFTVEHGCITTA